MSEPIEAVVWDVGRVLVQWDLGAIYAEAIPDPVERAEFLRTVVTEEWHFRHDAGEPMDALVAARIDEFPRHRALIERYRSHWLDSIPGPVEGTADLVSRLAEAGVPQFGITNFGADTWAMFRPHWPVFDHFADIVVSGMEKLVKPDPAIFALAAGRFGHAPSHMLFIDDNAANVAAAAAAGWAVHHFTAGAPALEADLKQRGLLRERARR